MRRVETLARIPEVLAAKSRDDDATSDVLRVTFDDSSPLLAAVTRAQRAYVLEFGQSLIWSWSHRRRYANVELAAARYFVLSPRRIFYPVGDESGTRYSAGCERCGLGRTVVGSLHLDLMRAPRAMDFAGTLAGDELIVSQRFADAAKRAGLHGFLLTDVVHRRESGKSTYLSRTPSGRAILANAASRGIAKNTGEFYAFLNDSENDDVFEQSIAEWNEIVEPVRSPKVPRWYRFEVVDAGLEIGPATIFGDLPFDVGGIDVARALCPLGHIAGTNVQSELFLASLPADHTDVAQTRQGHGNRGGTIQYGRFTVVNRRFIDVVRSSDLKGFNIEIARV